ncbi:aminotransferase class I/II-fold pyridoxal phosphate-dependent enzyme [Fusobacterium nucleatum subsp. nucleatum ATCC 23726]|uniref:Cystathionine beta-lyase n=2 Tax=Fusobacterium nucleatum subsp. nucleatum TaxID=76856 RepID=A0A101K6Y0_FUSNC|nr:aminotransferase class I/II-fold pyridoxal phosphate-dependent enzyme [Fusobacterium nucleatum]AVQ22439.1 cystathionine beta-lyase [Fusobacterium nucleatum subsp. nucleatum ATCC 23726]EFG94500.1 Cys/Met metabolism PLP-dependent enzyme [Fusobacterium nucleatum subsp. nucleatum ATCC 23726]KUL99637.1 cystathionine beta-lyase [Fusobacterium nucleatum subsp. nucleatum]MCG6843643.1 aminotransferase class I/II-fold pyridoxal phosphate-dependent enzyme [Fusobacterium nucleatum]WDD88945.1 aminotrans
MEKEYAEATELLYKGRKVKGMDFNKPEAFPLFTTTAFTMNSLTEVKKAYAEKYTYIRTCNPNRDALADMVTFLEAGEKSLIFSSGMGAITTTLMTILKPGDHVVCNRNIYGETFDVFTKLMPKFGISADLVDFDDIENCKKAIKAETKLIYSEVFANPTLNIADIPTLADIAHKNGALLMIDNTFSTPIAIKPIKFGADIVINSLTKFMNGHSDAIAGSITSTTEIIDAIHPVRMLCGTPGDPHAAHAMMKSFATMDLRLKKQMSNAAKLAAALEENKYVSKVNHPSLKSFSQHELALKLFTSNDTMSGMMSFIVPEDFEKIDKFMLRLNFAHYAMTLGGVRTTLVHPVTSSHSHMPDEARRAMGITPGLFRLSVGIEDVDDLIEDFNQALKVFGE